MGPGTAGTPPERRTRQAKRGEPAGARGGASGNCWIAESNCGRVWEAARECEIVWENISPHNLSERKDLFISDVFRAYRYPYDWAPQLKTPVERAVVPPAFGEFRIEPVQD